MPISSRPPLALLSGALLASPVLASVHYVRRDAGAGGDGTSWASAFQQVQDALAVAQAGDQVWVAKGTYRPGTGASPRMASSDVSSGIACRAIQWAQWRHPSAAVSFGRGVQGGIE